MKNTDFKSKEEFADWFKNKTKKFAVDVINLCKKLPQNTSTRVVSYQIIKSATLVAANYRAACRARSAKEFYAKLCIVVEEADESEFWLDMITSAKLSNEEKEVKRLFQEAVEILKIVSTARKNAGKGLKK